MRKHEWEKGNEGWGGKTEVTGSAREGVAGRSLAAEDCEARFYTRRELGLRLN